MIFEAWSKCREYLLPAIERTNGTHDEDDILRGLILGRYKLWPGKNSAIVTEFIEYDSGKMKSLNWFLVGGDMDELVNSMKPAIEQWAKSQGCKRVSCAGRKGWEKVLTDYEFGALYLYKDL